MHAGRRHLLDSEGAALCFEDADCASEGPCYVCQAHGDHGHCEESFGCTPTSAATAAQQQTPAALSRWPAPGCALQKQTQSIGADPRAAAKTAVGAQREPPPSVAEQARSDAQHVQELLAKGARSGREAAAALERVETSGAEVLEGPMLNENAWQQEIWLRGPEGYVVTVAGPREPPDGEW